MVSVCVCGGMQLLKQKKQMTSHEELIKFVWLTYFHSLQNVTVSTPVRTPCGTSWLWFGGQL